MNRILAEVGALYISGILMILAGSCADGEETLSPSQDEWRHSFFPAYVGFGGDILENNSIFIAIAESREIREINDPLISLAILSLLPEVTRKHLVGKGIVHIDDVEIASEIAIVSGMSTSDISGGIWLEVGASWSCLKCCYGDPPCCNPCPDCCEKDKDKVIETEEH